MLITKNIKSEDWDNYLESLNNDSFLNTSSFHELWEKNLQEKIIKRGIFENNSPVLFYNIVKKNLPFGLNFLFLPSSPLINELKDKDVIKDALRIFFDDLKEIAQKEKSIFIKIEPMRENKIIMDFFNEASFIFSKKEIEPQWTSIISLDKDQEKLFTSFHYKCRYNIRLAQKKGVKVKILKEPEDIKEAINLILKRSQEKKYNTFNKRYFDALIKIKNDPRVLVFASFYKNKLIASSIDVIYKGIATYLFGGLDYRYASLMAPYLLKWQEILYFKEQRLKTYDLWGICDPKIIESNQNHPLKGVTSFKLKFKGNIVHYPGSFDYIKRIILYSVYTIYKNLNFYN